jgi:hypothetical protein
MSHAFLLLNYLHVIVVAIIGFFVGFIWYSVLFGKAWQAEMKVTPEDAQKTPMGPAMIKGFIFTFISTWGLALLEEKSNETYWYRGAAFGATVGLLIVGARYLNSAVWEKRSCKLLAINIGHEVLLFTLTGAILAIWR